MRRLLVLRPEPGASETVARARDAGWSPLCVPLFETRAIAWVPPDPAAFDAVMLTSAAAGRLAGPGLDALAALPLLAVGAATAAAARAAGFAEPVTGDGDAADLLATGAARGWHRVLHLAGREHRAAAHPAVTVERIAVYAAETRLGVEGDVRSALDEARLALVHSARAGARLAELVDQPLRSRTRLAGISIAALSAAGPGWASAAAAAVPSDGALLAAAATLCDQARCGE